MCSKAIVSVSGAENEYITIDNVKYALDIANSFSGADKDKNLKKVSNSTLTVKDYSVKGDTMTGRQNFYIHSSRKPID